MSLFLHDITLQFGGRHLHHIETSDFTFNELEVVIQGFKSRCVTLTHNPSYITQNMPEMGVPGIRSPNPTEVMTMVLK
jgi:hypothetical protein